MPSSGHPARPDKPPYSLWYCPRYPVTVLSTGAPREDLAEARIRLREHIAQHGLANPLIVLNHRGPGFQPNWVMTGRNRLTVIKELGWDTAPAIVTGECLYGGLQVPPEDIDRFFTDGHIYWGHHGPRIAGYSVFEKGEFPNEDRR